MRKLWMMAVVALAGCGQSDQRKVEDAVKASMKDPSSAQFGQFSPRTGVKGTYACIGVNGRNTFGGYTGEQQAVLVKGDGESAGVWAVVDFFQISHEECLRRVELIAAGKEG